MVPAGYFKPLIPFSNIIYICPVGYYSIGAATICTQCSLLSFSSELGSTACGSPKVCAPGTVVIDNECVLATPG